MEFKCIACDGKMTRSYDTNLYSCSNGACAMQRIPAEQVARIEAFRERMSPKPTYVDKPQEPLPVKPKK
jgi:hypothetical protein